MFANAEDRGGAEISCRNLELLKLLRRFFADRTILHDDHGGTLNLTGSSPRSPLASGHSVLLFSLPCYPLLISSSSINSMSFFSQIMEPGGGMLLLPFVRLVIACLLLMTLTAAIVGFARIHMVVLSFLSGGMYVACSWRRSGFGLAWNAQRLALSCAGRRSRTLLVGSRSHRPTIQLERTRLL